MTAELFKRKRIGEIISGLKFLSLDVIEKEASLADCRLGDWLVKKGLINREQQATAVASQFELEYVELKDFTVPKGIFEICRVDDVYRLGIVPYAKQDEKLSIVIDDPLDLERVEEIERLYGSGVTLKIASSTGIKSVLGRSEVAARFLKTVSTDYESEGTGGPDGQHGAESITINDMAGQETSIEKFVNTVLLVAMKKRASDIHFEVYDSGVKIKYRIDGILYPATENLDISHHRAFITRIKVMAKLDIAENRVPQDGHFTLKVSSRDTDFRVSILPTVFGEDVVIRILDRSAFESRMKTMNLENVGFDEVTVKRFRKSIREPYGMILVTGPTGSGKTTTLYAAIAELNSNEEKIITIEDPVEYQINGIVQVPVNDKKKLTFAGGLRSILRHDPDKIVVGEIRDSETAQIAVQSALTGHLVFTTVHANNACDVIGRFNHMGINAHSFVSALNCVIAQRLLRNICPDCKEKAEVSSAELAASGLDPDKYGKVIWYEGRGCQKCADTGYMGRSAVAEYMDLSPRLRAMITEQRPTAELQHAAIEEGMVTLRKAALEKAVRGETTLKEVNRVTFTENQ
jgi:type IV pilus assembly protein PilB